MEPEEQRVIRLGLGTRLDGELYSRISLYDDQERKQICNFSRDVFSQMDDFSAPERIWSIDDAEWKLTRRNNQVRVLINSRQELKK